MSRLSYIKQRLQAKKRKLLFMKGGILAAGLCAAFFFISIPEANSGVSGLAERQAPVEPKPIEATNQPDQVVLADSNASLGTKADSSAPLEPAPQTQIAANTIAVDPAEAVSNPTQSNTPTDLEGGSRSTEGENTPTVETQTTPPVRFESAESVLGSPKPALVKKPAVEEATYMNMPSYESATLKYKLGLIGSDAYSPQDKAALSKHILGLFPSPNTPVEAVYAEAGGQQSTKSFPLKLYLLRLEQNPSIRLRSIEEVREDGKLAGLIIKE